MKRSPISVTNTCFRSQPRALRFRTTGLTPFIFLVTFTLVILIVCGFFGNQCLPLSKRAIQKSLLLGKLARSCGCETMGVCMKLFVDMIGVRKLKVLLQPFQLLRSAYSTISIQDTALFLGMSEDDATTFVQQQGWAVDPASQMLTAKKQPIVTEQKLDASKLQNLTEYVFHLEH